MRVLRTNLVRHTVLALIGIGLLWLLISVLPGYRSSNQIAPIAYTVCAAAGLSVLVGQSGQISLGHGAFMAVGAYTMALLQEHWVTTHSNLQLVGLLAASVVVTALFGAVVGVAAARLRGPYLAGVTLALALGLPTLASYDRLSGTLGGSSGLTVLPPISPAGVDDSRWQAFICCVAAVIVLWALANISRSRVGRSFRAVRDDEIAASLAGLSVARVQVLAFVLSAGCAGLGGALLAMLSLTAGPLAFQLSLSFALLAAVVFGGLGSLAGAVYGSILVVLLPQWSQDLASALSIGSAKISNNMPLMVYGVVLAVAMLAAPNGLHGLLRQLARAVTGRRPTRKLTSRPMEGT
jgi:branched-chain amino acid transport system permease protein